MRKPLWTLPLLAIAALSVRMFRLQDRLFNFDDAGMFFRYAMNLRQGSGIVWNLHGRPTFGITSLPWLFVTVAASYLKFPVAGAQYGFHQISHFMAELSWITSIVAVLFTCWAAMYVSQRRGIRTFSVVLLVVYAPLLLNEGFGLLAASGMETMFAFLLVAAFAVCVERFSASASTYRLLTLTAVATLLVFTRPDAILVVLSMPPLFSSLLSPVPKRSLLLYYALITTVLAASLMVARLYFGTALPLAFYIKSEHAYAGYQPYLDSAYYCCTALGMILIPLVLATFAFGRRHLRIVIAYATPFVVTSVYLFTVEQIMGWKGRYYFPFCALLLLGAIRILLDRGAPHLVVFSFRRAIAVALLIVAGTQLVIPICDEVAFFFVKQRRVYLPVQLATVGPRLLPSRSYIQNYNSFLQTAMVLPPRSVIALSEVGFSGAMLPKVDLIDTAGLNATDLATDGFQMADIYSKQPDLLWLMNPEYTQLAGRFFTDPHLLNEYDVYADVFGYGVGVRRSSPNYKTLEAALRRSFAQAYGPDLQIENQRVIAIAWDPSATRAGNLYDVQRF